MSEAQSVLNQQVHVLPGNAQVRWNCQRRDQCSINGFTYCLEMHKQVGIVRDAVCSINKFTYSLEMCKRDGTVRCAIGARSTTSHTSWKCASEIGLSEARSVLNKQAHVLPENVQVRWNCQRHSQSTINKFTYILEMRKQDGIVRGVISAQLTSSRTA